MAIYSGLRSGSGLFEAADADRECVGPLLHVVPRKLAGMFSVQLMLQRHGIVAIDEDEKIAGSKALGAPNDLAVFDRARDFATVVDFFCGNSREHVIEFFAQRKCRVNKNESSALSVGPP